jgi:phage tail-like protein
MPGLRAHALVRTADQWARAAHRHTSIDPATGGVRLSWTDPHASAAGGPAPLAGGLAFDAGCRLYHSVPAEGRVERARWRPGDRLAGRPSDVQPVDLLVGEPIDAVGDFELPAPGRPVLRAPRGLAVDLDDRLFVAETGADRVLVYDLWSRRLVRRVPLGRPLDLAASGRSVWALVADPPGIVRLEARGGPWPLEPLPAADGVPASAAPRRLAVSATGRLIVLLATPGGEGYAFELERPDLVVPVPGAGDLELAGDGALVVARGPGEEFRRFRREPDGWLEDTPLSARGYDGLGIVRTPDGGVGFWSDHGFRTALGARVRFDRVGRVTTYQLDSGEFQTQWGRLFLDACIPHGTEVAVHCATADEVDPDEDTIARTPPGNAVDLVVRRPDLSPPVVPVSLAPGDDDVTGRLHRRDTGRELPWSRTDPDDPFETYEAPVDAPAGRYLWITLELRGTTRTTPRLRSLRAEHPGHDELRRLPRAFSRDERVASFLRRYLALFDGALSDLDARAVARHALLDPRAAPAEVLPWLASFLGLTLDERWPEARRRLLVAEGANLFRLRGTVWATRRLLELYVGTDVMVVEHFRLRGLGGASLGTDPGTASAGSVVGANLRVGGAVGTAEGSPLEGTIADAFETHAHRFTVFIPAALGSEELDAVRDLLDVHRPAHTVVDVCTVGAGMRVGRGLHIGLSSILGRTGDFDPVVVGDAVLGRGSVLGRAESGARLGNSTLGEDTRVG